MSSLTRSSALILGISLILGLSTLGYFLTEAASRYKAFDRSVTVKGLSEREYKADIVLWPIQFNVASNDLAELYSRVERQTQWIKEYLINSGISAEEISVAAPNITDKSAQQYGGDSGATYRYSAFQTVTVYSNNVDKARSVMGNLSSLGKRGIVFIGNNYEGQTEYFFTRLNEVKPEMIEEATRKAREVAQKFAADSESKLGKIKRASQGQFSIYSRDSNNPHIKKVRVVSTVEYYLSD
ncbi:SIMPL domain-containing protein [Neptunomonas marina]|uniref:SIMPL domain-containing protein n=1 Tax=Neptunomonas marina TaxID=1815562 RepID=A0A437Q917_9GAMM|nr:SIMPL domain-containing protein [Neptunomonas marina]RVU31071.1 SIMPL domain-containing protein [Neptunomonas marina]